MKTPFFGPNTHERSDRARGIPYQMKPAFLKDQAYGWDFIRSETGATNPPDDERFLLHNSHEIVAACLDRLRNPNAPAEILAGPGAQRERWTDILIAQRTPIPVFVRENDGQWWYQGFFRVASSTDEPSEKNKRVKWPAIPSIHKILFLAEVTTQGSL